MAIPYRGATSNSTYFIIAGTYNKANLLQSDRMAALFCQTLARYREAGKLKLHAFVIMPNHIHLLITVPKGLTLERAMQFIKGFSFEAGKLFGVRSPIWQKSFVDRGVRDVIEAERYRNYIHQNPARAGLVGADTVFIYFSMNPGFEVDELPQRLKPEHLTTPLMHR